MSGPGTITHEMTAWCGSCEHWHQTSEHGKCEREFTTALRRAGWRRIDGKWVCPKCVLRRANR